VQNAIVSGKKTPIFLEAAIALRNYEAKVVRGQFNRTQPSTWSCWKNMRKIHGFTLVEVLVAVGIIAVLAGLLIPAVYSAQQRGRIAAANADMKSIEIAFNGLDSNYGKMVKYDGGTYYLGGKALNAPVDGSVTIGALKTSGEYADSAKSVYRAVIAELSDPSNAGISADVSVNLRRLRLLEPRGEYNPALNYDADSNKPHLWLDPWGNPYFIRINVDATDKIPDPTSSTATDRIARKIIVWSLGPDGLGSDTAADAANTDNICSWKANWR